MKSKIVNFSTAQFSHKFVNTWVYAAFDRWTEVNVGPEYVWKGRIHLGKVKSKIYWLWLSENI